MIPWPHENIKNMLECFQWFDLLPMMKYCCYLRWWKPENMKTFRHESNEEVLMVSAAIWGDTIINIYAIYEVILWYNMKQYGMLQMMKYWLYPLLSEVVTFVGSRRYLGNLWSSIHWPGRHKVYICYYISYNVSIIIHILLSHIIQCILYNTYFVITYHTMYPI